jgi:hypothetical protein
VCAGGLAQVRAQARRLSHSQGAGEGFIKAG